MIVDGPAGRPAGRARSRRSPAAPCETCAAGRGHLCPRVRFLGHSVTDGALRELVAWPAANLVPLPDTIDDVAGAMLEPLGVGIHALRLARVRPGDSVGVFGCGPIGLLLIQLARAAGATTIVATDRLPHRVEAAPAPGRGRRARRGRRRARRPARRDGGARRRRRYRDRRRGRRDRDGDRPRAPGGTVVVAGIPAGDHSTIAARSPGARASTFASRGG